jgi:DNA sulfur modification protein DndD
MKIERLEIENFGPYYGKNSISLGSGRQPLVLIHGDNMRGKTSFLNSIRWALYGVAKDRSGDAMPVRKLVNDDAYDEGNRFVSVTLYIATGTNGDPEQRYVLRRRRQAAEGRGEALADTDYEEFLDLERDNTVLSPTHFEEIVNTLLPEPISRFFLFDGELLNEYEELVREGGHEQAEAVREAIEMILGVPAATHGRDDVAELRAEVSRQLQREGKKHDKAKRAADQLEFIEEERRKYVEDRARLQAQLQSKQTELRSLEEDLKRFEEMREDAGRLDAANRLVEQLQVEREETKKQRRDLVRELWRDALAPRLKFELERLDRERHEISLALQEQNTARRRRGDLAATLEQGTCETCGQPMPEESSARVRAEVAELDRRIESLDQMADGERLEELSGSIRRLRDVAPAGVSSGIRAYEHSLQENTLRRQKTLQDIDKLKDNLRGQDPQKILEYERKQDDLVVLISQIEDNIKRVGDSIKQRDADIEGLERELREADVPALRRLTKEQWVLERLGKMFDESITDLVAQLRVEVESEATAIFKQLTTEQTYAGLEINDQYGLTILRGGNKQLAVRSAGAEQVVALSLIGALNRLAIKKGPVIMDTPFGRLDPGHRANILRFIPTLAEQVVLLVHRGEVDRTRDLEEISSRVDAEYVIRRISSSRSEIVPLTVAS